MNNSGLLFVISGPSGVGKGTVIKCIREKNENIYLSISCTTRAPRHYETHGRDYYFISENEFYKAAEQGDFFEHAIVFGGTGYGTLKSEIEKRKEGRDVFLEIDVQGATNARTQVPELVSIFVAPPSVEVLENRLRGRASDSEESIKKRLETALGELKRTTEYDYVVINEDVEECADEILEIIAMEHKKHINAERVKTLIDGK